MESLADIFGALEGYKYLIIFPLTVVEGPIITIICGFLVYLGVMKFWIAFPLLALADIVGDCVYYGIGRYSLRSERAKRYARFVGYSDASEAKLEEHFRKHKFETLFFAKFAHGIGAVIQISSGIAKVDFLHFFVFSFFSTLLKALILMIVGFYAGTSIAQIDNLLSTVALVVVIAFIALIVGYVFLNKRIKKFFSE